VRDLGAISHISLEPRPNFHLCKQQDQYTLHCSLSEAEYVQHHRTPLARKHTSLLSGPPYPPARMVFWIWSSYCTPTAVAALLVLIRLALEEAATEAVPLPQEALRDYLWLYMLLREMAWNW
jgi:hypothetical protein